MGQYYHVLMKKGHKEYHNDLRCSDNEHVMLKLMEHSWWDVDFTNTISRMLYENGPMRVWWIGDYSGTFYDDEWNEIPEEKLTEEQRKTRKLGAKVWANDADERWKPFRPDKNPLMLDHKYMVNKDKNSGLTVIVINSSHLLLTITRAFIWKTAFILCHF